MKDPEVRPKLVCSPKYAVQKARKGKKLNRWEIEDLAKDPEQSFFYANKVLRGRFLEGEPAIARSVHAYEYAKNVVKGRWEEVEPIFIESISLGHGSTFRAALAYFVHVAGVRNPEIEKYILRQDHSKIVTYCENCVKGRWKEAEKTVLKSDSMGVASDYHSEIHKGIWPEWEDRILFTKKLQWHEDRCDLMTQYLKTVPQPGPEFEKKLEKTNRAKIILTYALKGCRGRLPDALHQKMLMFSFDPKRKFSSKKYVKFLVARERQVVRYLSRLNDEERAEILEKARTN